MPAFISDQRRLDAARRIFEHLAKVVDIPFSLRLWDGTMVSLGHDATEHRYFSISGPGVLGDHSYGVVGYLVRSVGLTG